MSRQKEQTMRKGIAVFALGALLVFTVSGCSIMKESRIKAECVESIDKSSAASDRKAAEARCAEFAEGQTKVDASWDRNVFFQVLLALILL